MTSSEIKRSIIYAKQAGFYRGLLTGLLWSMSPDYGHYNISEEIVQKAKDELEEFEKEQGEMLNNQDEETS